MLTDKNFNQKPDIQLQNIPVIEIDDPYAYITSGKKLIVILSIKGTQGVRDKRKVSKTRRGYVME